VTTNHTISASFDGGWYAPSSNVNGTGGAAFNNPGNAYTSDNAYASGGNNDNVTYGTFNIPAIPPGAVIDGIEVALEGNDNGRTVTVAISGDGGGTFAPTSFGADFTATDSTLIFGGTTNLWGGTWTNTSFTNANFRVRLTSQAAGGGTLVNIDQLQVKIHFTLPTTLTVSPATGSYGGTVTLSATLSPALSGRTINFTLNGNSVGSAVTDGSGVATIPAASLAGINAGVYPGGAGSGIEASYAGEPGYLSSNGTATLTVNKANATIVVTPYNVTYNGLPHTATGSATGVSSEPLSGLDLSATTHTNAGAYNGDPWTFTDVTGNYNNANGTVDNVINRANATIVVTPYNVTYDALPHTATGSATGVLGEALSGLDLSGTTHTNAGTYNGDPWTFTDVTGNYNNANGTVDNVINRANATIVVTPYNVTYDALPHTATGSATGVLGEALSGLDLSGTTHTNAGTYNGDPWTFTDVTGNYNNANSTVDNVINPASATVTLSNLTHTYDGTPKSATVTTVPGGLSFSITYDGSPTAPTDAGSYAVIATITDPNYTGSANDTLVIDPATVTPSINADNKEYNGTTAATFTCSLGGVIVGDTVSCTGGTANFDDKNVGNGKTVTATGLGLGGADAGNYQLSSTTAADTANITERTLNVTATGVNKVYDGNTNATVTLSDDRVGGDNLTVTYTSASFPDPNVGAGKTVNVSGISISGGADAGNYILGNTTAVTTADITPASQTITVTQNAPSSAANGTTFDVAATASSGLPVTITTSGSCSGGDTDGDATVTMTSGTGTCSVFYDQAGNANYSAAPQVQEDVNATESPAFTSADNAAFDVGFAGSFTVTAVGNPSTMTITQTGALPSGVTFTDNGDGTATLSGTPAVGSNGVYNLIFTADNGVPPNGIQNFTLTVKTGPIVGANGVGSNPDTGDGSITENEVIVSTLGIAQLTVEFSQDVYDPADDTDPDDVTNPANYLLVRGSAGGTFSTVSCEDGLAAPDVAISVDSVTYSNGGGSGPFIATLNINGGFPLNVAGFYRLFVCGTTSIVDADNTDLALAGDGVTPGTDFVRNFRLQDPVVGGGGGGEGGGRRVTTTAAVIPSGVLIPVTGFAPNAVTALPAQPAENAYAASGLKLEIPSLSLNLPIVGVNLNESGWDVTWLNGSAGYLEGSAYPTWKGNTVLTGHVTDTNGKPGPFAYLKELAHGDKLYIYNSGFIYVYQVQQNSLLAPNNVKALFKSEEYDWLTLVTCEDYDQSAGQFKYRRMVRATLISVIPAK
jgi:LPXTG-site transpeptidase (sortase) family protein